MMKRIEFAVVCTSCSSCLQLVLYKCGEQLFGLDQGYLYVAVRISLEEELLLDSLRKDCEYSHGLLGQAFFDECILVSPGWKSIELICLAACEKLVDLLDQYGELRNELYDTLRDDSNTEVHAVCCSGRYGISDIVSDLGKGHLLLGNLLRDEADVRLSLQCTFQSNVGSGTSHYLDEVPVFLCGIAVSLDVSDQLTVGLGSGIETEGALNIVVLQVAVDGLRASDNLYAGVVCCEVLSKNCSIRIGIVTTNDNNCSDAVLLANFSCYLELLLGLELCSAGTDDVETAGVAELIDVFVVEDQVFVLDQSARAALESVKDVLRVGSL